MKLFRQLLLSLFPQEVLHQQMNPASMFVSFISPKQFFSVINRKVVENYKLNLFDIGLDPFEVKIGFGDQPTLNVKDIDFYYAYNATANLNGRNFYTPGNVGTALSIVMAIMTKDIFKPYRHTYYISFLVSVYLMTFVFVSRIKVFPHTDKEKNYRRFIDLFFTFYEMSLEESGQEIDDRVVAKIKHALLQEIQLFFMLFYVYRRINRLFATPAQSDSEFYQWLFYDEAKKGKQKALVGEFIQNAHVYSKIAAFSDQDKVLMKVVFPADILIRYILQGEDSYVVADKLLTGLYDAEVLKSYLHSFLQDDSQLEACMSYIMDWKVFKDNYFTGIKKLTTHKFRLKHDFETSQEIDSFMSSLEDVSSLDGVKVPDALKRESMMMDRLVNFYITYIGGLRVARGDNFYLRMFRKPLIEALLVDQGPDTSKQDALFFYGGLLYNYSKNIFYYTYAYENVKAGYDSFNLPLRPSFKEVYSNMFILKLFDESFVHTLLQDLNTKSIKISLNNKGILSSFKEAFGSSIGAMIRLPDEEFVREMYGNICFFIQNMPHMLPLLQEHLTSDDLATIKENLYALDIQLWRVALQWLYDRDVMLSDSYGDMSILGIFTQMRETLFGFLLWYTYVLDEQEKAKIDLSTEALKKIYIVDVLNLSEYYFPVFSEMIDELVTSYHHLLLSRGTLDDNAKYFGIGVGNWLGFIEKRNKEQITHEIMGEDVIWFRGYVKTITYYNKRYLIPK